MNLGMLPLWLVFFVVCSKFPFQGFLANPLWRPKKAESESIPPDAVGH